MKLRNQSLSSPPFSTYILDNVLEKKKFQKEKLRTSTLAKVDAALSKLSREVLFKEAYIFGSLQSPRKFSKYSDIDIGFIGLKDRDFFKAHAFLSRELATDIDIIQLEEHKFKDKIIRDGIKWKRKN
jgi:hypothetical protein